jgi:peptidoglycan glycosyltransferase
VHTTIDANLQFRVANIIADYARKAGARAAAAVIDPDTGELLASASYPWPAETTAAGRQASALMDPYLDRARYGLYPPGSTFKLVVESAALREGLDPGATTFTCSRLADGRVGARIAGWGRPVRDDVLDTSPHGTINMHQGLVHSCNAYFAQLAVRLGPQPLMDVATRLGLSLTPAGNPLQRGRETLPQVGYGQGDVLVSPLRMARVAGAVAASGVLTDVQWDKDAAAPEAKDVFLKPGDAQRLGSDMREVVLSGTGRSLRGHPWRIAGKTGTAEVTGKLPHGWFVGFAPYGPASRRIAFAVVIENAGYGGASAAPAAGEIVSAAALAGLIK